MIKYTFDGEFPPTVGTKGAAGLDLCAQTVTNNVISTGVRVEIPPGWVGILLPRSSWGAKGWTLANTVGVIDSDYRGEIMASMTKKFGTGFDNIKPGDKVCQLIVIRTAGRFEQVSTEQLSVTERGDGAFGSTGGA
jgi:dUTP pyrophosphatase